MMINGYASISNIHFFNNSNVHLKNNPGKNKKLTEEEKEKIEELKRIDQRVRSHERAHLSAAGGIAISGANYSFVAGPDGKRYAVAGEVNIDTSPGKKPEETIEKAQRIIRAALAPADPSPQDRRVAAKAMQMQMKAKQELLRENQDKKQENENQNSDVNNNIITSTYKALKIFKNKLNIVV